MAKPLDLTERRFGALTAKRSLGAITKDRSGGSKRTHYWLCLCDCGEEFNVRVDELTSGRTTTCGYIRDGKHVRKAKHGGSKTIEHKSYLQMIRRTGPKAKPEDRANYYNRGISVCERWNTGDGSQSGFECFLMDVGSRPSVKHSIDRIDNNGNYEPGNCKWSTSLEQNRNTRKTNR